MKKIFSFIIASLVFANVYGQQDPIFTKYMFNSLVINPAYAGSEGHLSMGILHRSQWFGLGGAAAPQTQTITVHTPLKNERVGVGGSLINDAIGATNTFTGNLCYAYRIPMRKWNLSFGLQAGAQYYNFDPSKLSLQTVIDNAFTPYTKVKPNFGGGIYLYKEKKFYAGLGVPHLIEWDLREKVSSAPKDTLAKQYRHYFFTMGGTIPLNGDALLFKPSLMVRNTGLLSKFNKVAYYKGYLAPTSFDVDLSLMFYQTLWLGAAYRSALEQFTGTSSFSSVNAWGAYYLKNGMRIGAAYDYPLTTKFGQAAIGSFELFLGYDFDYKVKKVVTPRYF
jgi:type IX secretion system PorP/SprF family membrane protein